MSDPYFDAGARQRGGQVSADDYNADVFASRAVSPDVAEERGYRCYLAHDLDPIYQADGRLLTGTYEKRGERKRLEDWVRDKGSRSHGWVMPKRALPASTFDAPLAQLRPDDPVPGIPYGHDHNGMQHLHEDCPCGIRRHSEKWLDRWPIYGYEPALGDYERDAHENGKMHRKPDGTLYTPLDGPHRHVPASKYLIPPGPHGKRWDTHPRCTTDRFLAAERVFVHLEGTLKCDSLVSAGEVAIDVPSVTMWARDAGDESAADYPDVSGFWAEYRGQAQADDLLRFVDVCVTAPVIVVCDSDWHHNAEVATQAFCLRDWFRERGLNCLVAAPEEGPRLYTDPRTGHAVMKKVGSDDFFGRDNDYPDGTPDTLVGIEPVDVPGLVAFSRQYEKARTPGGRRHPVATRELDLEVLHWYATHSTATGHVKRPATTIARRLGVSDDAVYDATVRLAEAGALKIEGQYAPLVDTRLILEKRRRAKDRQRRTRNLGRGQAGPTATIRLRDDLRPRVETPLVGEWLRKLQP
jgi:hypothetical protein